MRNLKFRVWHTKLKKWLDNSEWFITLNGELCYYDLGDGIPLSSDYGIKLVKLEKDLYIIQEFTGLLDKSGREIYEGDIIETYVHDDVISCLEKYKYNLIVYFDEEGFWAGKVKMDKYTGESFPFYADHYEIILNKTKILGNIFENPELLK